MRWFKWVAGEWGQRVAVSVWAVDLEVHVDASPAIQLPHNHKWRYCKSAQPFFFLSFFWLFSFPSQVAAAVALGNGGSPVFFNYFSS